MGLSQNNLLIFSSIHFAGPLFVNALKNQSKIQSNEFSFMLKDPEEVAFVRSNTT